MIDYVGLVSEAAVLVVLAAAISDANGFAWALAALLGIDVLWSGVAAASRNPPLQADERLDWLLINLIAAPTVALVAASTTGTTTVVLLVIITTVRTMVDYATSWDFYGGDFGPGYRSLTRERDLR